MSAMGGTGRITSMDQFRGYSVAGMFLVNFLGGMAVTPSVLRHNNTYFSYADSIMPGFLFACGFSYRLSLLRRVSQHGRSSAYRHVVNRSLGLILVSLVLYGCGMEFDSWSEMTAGNVREFVARLLKANLWEVLAIIGAVQLLILPVVEAPSAVRAAAMVGLSALHLILSHSFNYDFVYGRPNWMDEFWGAAGQRCWDGGFFGLLQWAVPMLAGTIVFDVVRGGVDRKRVRKLVAWGAVFMVAAYLLSGLNHLYSLENLSAGVRETFTASPVFPPSAGFQDRTIRDLLADPPFVEPGFVVRSYWLMDKRIVTGTFIWFSTGFAIALYGLFVAVCDLGGRQFDLFRMLGQNPLAAYIIHHIVESTIRSIVPVDSPLWWTLVGLFFFFMITILFVKYVDRNRIL